MKVKFFEVRDRMTFIPVMVVALERFKASFDADYLLKLKNKTAPMKGETIMIKNLEDLHGKWVRSVLEDEEGNVLLLFDGNTNPLWIGKHANVRRFTEAKGSENPWFKVGEMLSGAKGESE